MAPPLTAIKGLIVLKRNIAQLLADRHENQVQLARACGHKKSWINKFFKDETNTVELQLRDLDKIADFFGIEVHQLFQPGIGRLTERRLHLDRRATAERRIGHQGRELAKLRAEADKLPRSASHGAPAAHSSADSAIQRVIERAARDIRAIEAGRQTPTDGPDGAKRSKDRRAVRRPAAKPA